MAVVGAFSFFHRMSGEGRASLGRERVGCSKGKPGQVFALAEALPGIGTRSALVGSVKGMMTDDIRAHELKPACGREEWGVCFMVLKAIQGSFDLNAVLLQRRRLRRDNLRTCGRASR